MHGLQEKRGAPRVTPVDWKQYGGESEDVNRKQFNKRLLVLFRPRVDSKGCGCERREPQKEKNVSVFAMFTQCNCCHSYVGSP